MSRKKDVLAGLPDWFDEQRHRLGDAGIYETATGTLLAADGLPESAAARMIFEQMILTEKGVTNAS